MATFPNLMTPVYATPAQVRRMLGTDNQSTNDDDILLWLCDLCSRRIEEYCNRRFYMYNQTMLRDWRASYMMELPEDLHTLTTLTNGDGNTIDETTGTTTNWLLYPNYEYPKYKIEITINSGKVFLYTGTPQQAISLNALWGYPAVTNSGQHNFLTSATVQNATSQNSTTTSLVVQTGSFVAGQTLLIGSEFEIVQSVTTGATDTLTVLRGAAGSTAATHLNGVAIYQEVYHPAIVNAMYLLVANSYRQKDSQLSGDIGIAGYGQLTIPLDMPPQVKGILNQFVRNSWG